MQAPHVVADEDISRPTVTVWKKGSVLLSMSKMGTGSSGKNRVSQLVVPGDSFAMTSTADSVVAIAVAPRLTTCYAVAVKFIDWKAKSI